MEVQLRGDEISLHEVFTNLVPVADQKKRELLDNRMVSVKNVKFNAFVYVGNYWFAKPA